MDDSESLRSVLVLLDQDSQRRVGVNAILTDSHVALMRDRVEDHVQQQLMPPDSGKSTAL